MGALNDLFGFDTFAMKDIWRGIKKDPERLLVGAADPWSTKLWNKALDKDWEPLVDQMGGPYGGHTISAFGNTDGGTYKRAREAGIDTGVGEGAHDLAHVVAAFYGGQGLMGLGGGGGGAQPTQGNDWSQFARMQPQGMQQDPNAAQREAEERRRRQREEEERKKREQLAEALKRLTEPRYV